MVLARFFLKKSATQNDDAAVGDVAIGVVMAPDDVLPGDVPSATRKR